MHIEVVPLLGASLAMALESLLILRLLNHFVSHRVVAHLLQVRLGEHQHHRHIRLNLLDLTLPPLDVLEGLWRVDRHADHKYVCILVLSRSIHAQVLISAGVMNLDLDLLFLDIFGAAEDIENCWLVVFGEAILQVVANQAGFADRSVANEHDLNLLRPIVINLTSVSRLLSLLGMRRNLVLACLLTHWHYIVAIFTRIFARPLRIIVLS